MTLFAIACLILLALSSAVRSADSSKLEEMQAKQYSSQELAKLGFIYDPSKPLSMAELGAMRPVRRARHSDPYALFIQKPYTRTTDRAQSAEEETKPSRPSDRKAGKAQVTNVEYVERWLRRRRASEAKRRKREEELRFDTFIETGHYPLTKGSQRRRKRKARALALDDKTMEFGTTSGAHVVDTLGRSGKQYVDQTRLERNAKARARRKQVADASRSNGQQQKPHNPDYQREKDRMARALQLGDRPMEFGAYSTTKDVGTVLDPNGRTGNQYYEERQRIKSETQRKRRAEQREQRDADVTKAYNEMLDGIRAFQGKQTAVVEGVPERR